MDYEQAVDAAPPGWRHYEPRDLHRLPMGAKTRELARIPPGELRRFEEGDSGAQERVLKAAFWSLVYHLDPEKWDALAGVEPIDGRILDQLPSTPGLAVDVGAGSGRLTAHLLRRCGRVLAVEPARGLASLLKRRHSSASVVAGWAEALPLPDCASQLTSACGSLGPDPAVLAELSRVTAIGGTIALISPESPEWFESEGWRRVSVEPTAAPQHDRWIDEFFGLPDPPHELVMTTVHQRPLARSRR